MKTLIKSLSTACILFSILATLSACGPIYNSSYTFTPPKSWNGKQCVNQCLENRSSCKMQCNNQNQQCRNSARLAALPAYLAYTHNKDQQTADPNKTIDSFANYSGCNDSCGCDDTYNQCYTNCGGVITEYRRCVAFCDKA